MSAGRLLKVEGAGNDFLLGVGAWAGRLAGDAALVRRLCHRRHGIGADGVLALFPESPLRLRLDYRNGDGSPARFCANGTRCAARAAVELLGMAPRLVVATGWAEIPAEVDGARVSLELPAPPGPPRELVLDTPHGSWRATLLELGVPHLVLETTDLAKLDLARVAPPLRHHPELAPAGCNVSFVEVVDAGRLEIRSFERGVEGETLCCGSAVAAAGLLHLAHGGRTAVSVGVRSGDRLLVEAAGSAPNGPSRLSGPARMVAELSPSAELVDAG